MNASTLRYSANTFRSPHRNPRHGDDWRVVLYALLIAIAIGIVSMLCFVGCSHESAADMPAHDRQANWLDSHDEGSCAWACLVSLLRANGDSQAADAVLDQAGGPVYTTVSEGRIIKSNVLVALDQFGVAHIETGRGDVAFLIESCERGSGCVVPVERGGHAVALVAIDESSVRFIGPNHRALYRQSREAFLADWRASGGWAICPLPSGWRW